MEITRVVIEEADGDTREERAKSWAAMASVARAPKGEVGASRFVARSAHADEVVKKLRRAPSDPFARLIHDLS